jgi:hypothetical protein
MSIDLAQLTDTIVTTKRRLRRDLLGRAEVFAEVEAHIEAEVREIRAETDRGGSVIPDLDYASIAGRTVSGAQMDEIRRRGVVIVRNVFPRAQAEAWDDELATYLATNEYGESDVDATLDQYFSTLESARPQISGIYWSPPQVLARQAPSLAETRACLNGLWISARDGEHFFDPTQECTYADRIRRREPGDTSLGLSAHMDAGSVERWLDPAYRRVCRHVFSGQWRAFDPFDGAHRTEVREIPSPAVCSMFRTYQGWTALTRQGPDDGTLRVVPIAAGVAYLLLRALQDDVPEDDLCGARPGRALSAIPEWHAAILEGLITIPVVEPGDTVWWHPDVLHAVEDRNAGTGYSNVMYIGAAPACGKNRSYLDRQRPAFVSGASPPDFAPENHEVGYRGRAAPDLLTELGRRQMGFGG